MRIAVARPLDAFALDTIRGAGRSPHDAVRRTLNVGVAWPVNRIMRALSAELCHCASRPVLRAGREVRSEVWRLAWEDAREVIWSHSGTVWEEPWEGIAPAFREDFSAGIVRAAIGELPWP